MPDRGRRLRAGAERLCVICAKLRRSFNGEIIDMPHRATPGSRLARSGTCWTGQARTTLFGTPLHLGVNLATRGVVRDVSGCWPRAASDRSRRSSQAAKSGAPGKAQCPAEPCEQGFVPCGLVPAACPVLWRSGVSCERASPAGHGWPRGMGTDGRLADVRNFRRWAVPPENSPDSTGFIVVASRESPPNGEEPFFSDPVYEKLSAMGLDPAVRQPQPPRACPLARRAMRPAIVPAVLRCTR